MTNQEGVHSKRPRSEKAKPLIQYFSWELNWHEPQLPQIEIILGKSDKFDELMAAAAEERGEVEDGEEQAWKQYRRQATVVVLC
jgi:hypothetical protein